MNENPSRVVIYLTRDEHERLSDAFRDSSLANTHKTYENNHPFGEFLRQLLQDNPDADVDDYGSQSPSVRYTEQVTVKIPPEQYEGLRENYESTPISDDKNGRYVLGGNTSFAEFLRRCLTQSLS